MEASVEQEKSLVIILVKQKLCLCWHYNYDNKYLFVNGKEIHKFKVSNKKMLTFQINVVRKYI